MALEVEGSNLFTHPIEKNTFVYWTNVFFFYLNPPLAEETPPRGDMGLTALKFHGIMSEKGDNYGKKQVCGCVN